MNATEAEVGNALRRYQAAVDDFDRLAAEKLGLNRTDARCVEMLLFDFPDGATPAELGSSLWLTSGSVTTMVDRLVEAGFAVRMPHPIDKRKVIVTATAHARDAALSLHRPLVDRGSQLLSRYAESELATMIDFLNRATALQREEEAKLRHGET